MGEILYRQDEAGQFIAVTPVSDTGEQPEEQFYVHLADGTVHTVSASELPVSAGSGASMGYYKNDEGVSLLVIGVYPAPIKR